MATSMKAVGKRIKYTGRASILGLMAAATQEHSTTISVMARAISTRKMVNYLTSTEAPGKMTRSMATANMFGLKKVISMTVTSTMVSCQILNKKTIPSTSLRMDPPTTENSLMTSFMKDNTNMPINTSIRANSRKARKKEKAQWSGEKTVLMSENGTKTRCMIRRVESYGHMRNKA